MIEHPIEGDYRNWILNAFRQTTLFAVLDAATMEQMTQFCRLVELEAGEYLTREGDASENFYVILIGEALVTATDEITGEQLELERIAQHESVGELGMLLQSQRSATVRCTKQTYVVVFDRGGFDYLLDSMPGFARQLSRQLAGRLTAANDRREFPIAAPELVDAVDDELVAALPDALIREQRVFPLKRTDGQVILGFVDPPSRETVAKVRQAFGDAQVELHRLPMRDFERLARRFELLEEKPAPLEAVRVDSRVAPVLRPRPRGSGTGTQTSVVTRVEDLSRIEPLLRRMIQTGASDLHLSAMQRPRWRIDGDMYEIADFGVLGDQEVLDLVGGLIPDAAWADFETHSDCDFAFSVEDLARFRTNVFRDDNGASAVLRLVPMHVPTMEQLGLPKAARQFCSMNQGLVLVCGPTGSGKSTTLAAMIDHINNTRRSHIITIEDPIEFRHESKVAMVTQREVGKNTTSFQRGLRASLREDPDIILVGELRDRATMSLALETALTGHLVLSTMHTSTAIGTIDRVIEMFPHDQHDQVRSTLADSLKGVVNQQLLKRTGGGRIAAFECLVGTGAVGNCIRQGKTHQIQTVMTTNKKEGHRMLNQDLQELVHSNAVEPMEALLRAPDKKDLRARLGLPND